VAFACSTREREIACQAFAPGLQWLLRLRAIRTCRKLFASCKFRIGKGPVSGAGLLFFQIPYSMKAINVYLQSRTHYFRGDKRLLFLLLCALIFVNNYFMREFVLTKEVFYRTYGEQVAIEKLDEYFTLREQLKWFVFAFIPVILLIKISLISLCINTGAELTDNKITFKKTFQVVLASEIVFIVATYVRSICLYLFVDAAVMQDIQQYYPLSLASVLPMNEIPSWLVYPLLTLNLFEVMYVLVLSLGISHALQKSFSQSLKLVFASYGTGLLIWMVIIVFLTINFT
jgi:hypothetical protein